MIHCQFYYQDNNKSVQVGFINNQSANLCTGNYANICDVSYGVKYPEADEWDHGKILSVDINLNEPMSEHSYNELDPFIFASPNQQAAGSCLYMASAGAMEILLNQNVPAEQRVYEGDTDISERYLMNVSESHNSGYAITDEVLLFNLEGGMVLNKDYRFTKDWMKTVQDKTVKAKPEDEGAFFSTRFNWFNDYNDEIKEKLVPTTPIERSILFIDPDKNRWNVGIMSDDVIEQVKNELRTRNVPVLVIYNHYAYWHAVLIVGYDDEKETGSCPFVTSWKEYMDQMATKYENSDDPKLNEKANTYRKYYNKVVTAMQNQNGCREKGVFLIRDSIYQGPNDLMYDYNPNFTEDNAPYSKRIVIKSYDWLKYLGNHAYSVHTP